MEIKGEAEILIVGAGVVGAAVAREFSRYNLRVLLLEQEVDVCFGTSKANSGIVHSGIHDQPGSLKARFCVAGNKLYPDLAAELDVLYQKNGAIIVAQKDMDLPLLEELRGNGKANGVVDISILSPADLLKMEPNLSPNLSGGLLVPSGGIVAPFDLTFALIENAIANGVKLWLGTEVIDIRKRENTFWVMTNQGLFKTNYLINAAGVYSSNIARLVGDRSFTILPKKGEEYLLDRRNAGLVTRTIFPMPRNESKGILVIPTVDGNIMIGPTAQKTSSFDDITTSDSGWQEVFEEVKKIVPAISPSEIIASFAGIRATSDQPDFIIGPSPVDPKFINITGIKSPGLTAAPAIAQYLVELLTESGLHFKLRRDFQPERRLVRLRHLSHEQQAELIRKDPRYANIICRCELVSEAEIRDAITRGATTIDGVKLRTRVGMGRCQGGFCTPSIIQIISEQLGIPPERVTKKGPGSSLIVGQLRP